jgi:PAS domain S-box-containing protein
MMNGVRRAPETPSIPDRDETRPQEMTATALPPTILVVDDDEGLLRLISSALKREKWAVATASSGAAGLEWLRRNSADLLLLDLKLQDIEGKQFIGALSDLGRSVPFIIITGQGDERVAVEMMKRGALDYLVKDVQFVEFVPAVVRRALDHLARAKRLAEAEEALRKSEANLARAQQIAHVGSYEIDVAGTSSDHWSAETFRILGLDPATRDSAPGEYSLRGVLSEDQATVREAFNKARHERVPFDLEYRIARPDGSIRHVHTMVEPVLDAHGNVLKLVGTLQDITDRRQLEKEILQISEREQSRIGQDLHDGLCQHLAGIEFRLLALKQKLEEKSKPQAADAAELARLIREGIEQTRTLSRGLSPVMLEPDGLMNALQELAIATEKAFKISCALNCPTPLLVYDNAVATHLYRIAQEAVQNALRHGKAKTIVVHLLRQNDRLVLAVKDDGVAFTKPPPRHPGMGLRVMQYRAGMVGGSLIVQHEPGVGTSVLCSLRAAKARVSDETHAS